MILEVFSGLKAYTRDRTDRKSVCNFTWVKLQYRDDNYVYGGGDRKLRNNILQQMLSVRVKNVQYRDSIPCSISLFCDTG